MDQSRLDFYADCFGDLRKDKNSNKYPEHTRHAAPHKPLLLLAVIDLFAEGSVEENLIPHDNTKGARVNDVLFNLLRSEESRDVLRTSLIEAHFTQDVHKLLINQGTLNIESFRYSRKLLDQARRDQRVKEPPSEVDRPDPVRDQGFRRAIVEAYDHRCAVSGIRILTADRHTAVEAAHIKPWNISHDDNPKNGLALSKLCHWAFEEGLITVSTEYVIRLSKELSTSYNSPGYLGTLEGRSIHLPEEAGLQPGPEYLAWHHEEKFRN